MYDLFFSINIIEILVYFVIIFITFHIFPFINKHFQLTKKCFILISLYMSGLLAVFIFITQGIETEPQWVKFVVKNTTELSIDYYANSGLHFFIFVCRFLFYIAK